MKTLLQFLSEAPKTSRAVEKARRLGLISDGHGNWYDREGNYKGYTDHGELVLTKGRGKAQAEDPRQKPAGHTPSAPAKGPQQAPAAAAAAPAPEEEGGEKEDL